MRKVKSPEDLTIEELRYLLIDKRRKARQAGLEHFRRTGRVVTLASDYPEASLDGLHTGSAQEEQSPAENPWRHRARRLFDGLLFGIEVLAVIGLVFILFNGLEILRSLNREVAQALVLPTPSPTPLISAVVLPSGHTPPNSPGGARPNEAEIPEHLRPLVQPLASIPIPTPGPQQAIRLQIPAIDVDAPIVQGDGWEQLKKGVGQHVGSVDPGKEGNLVLTAHNDVFGEIFRYLDRLKPGDQVIVHTDQRTYNYVISGTEIVEPTQVEVMAPTAKATLTLISCYPYLIDNQRIVVKGVLQNDG